MSVNNTLNKYLFAFMAIILVGISLRLSLQGFADDLVFSHALDNINIKEYMLRRYIIWSGRFTLDALMVGTINMHPVWKIGIPVSLFLLCASVSRIINGKFSTWLCAAFLCLFMMIPLSVNENAAWWVTGFYNYLLPVSLMAYSFSVFMKKDRVGFAEGVFAIISLSVSCFNEQTAIFTVASSILLTISERTYRRKYSYLFIIFALANSAILFLSPGNYVRSEKEAWRWIPGFQDMTMVQKLTFGFDRVHQTVVMHDGIIFGTLCFLCICLLSISQFKSKTASFFKLVMIIHLVIMAIKHFNLTNLGVAFYNEDYLNPQRWISYGRYASYFFSLLVIISVFYSLSIASTVNKTLIKPLIALLLGYATVAMLSFSPTVFASWMRVLFVWEVVAAAACLWIYYEMFSKDVNRNSYLIFGLMATAALMF
ncbi:MULTISPECIES: hypothetical protein [Pantoea]|uniref:hypothetical protein n=1 Tax=Pantoea TaxID=53335 RepID=UPI000EA3A9EA|nr:MULTISPECIES: hypothetical protein [Pantoea]MBZ6388542.1 hypothetical protein [Pantoea piersonii]MBZ6402272.1 hypothetical protein [Pantoea piersonii]MBZ6410523.1 hypothetical protein [Pantoea piersonii]MBZ6427401.1 hypothetical protein [Pantoea piersonii]NYB02311.1 hypothetical protein [Pantoea piersonii]